MAAQLVIMDRERGEGGVGVDFFYFPSIYIFTKLPFLFFYQSVDLGGFDVLAMFYYTQKFN